MATGVSRQSEYDFNGGVLPDISLRAITVADWSAVHEWASTEEACRYQPWGPNTPAETRAFARDAVTAWSQDPQDRYVWVAEESAAVVGLGELKVRSRRWQQGDIAYAVHVDHWGRGVGTAIATKLLTFAFASLGLHRVGATCDPRNAASAAVLRRVGMTHEGRLRHTIRIRDGWRDSDVYSILSDEWQSGSRTAEGP
jgi:ribosomal-protein-alanine N-acetyltransferase